MKLNYFHVYFCDMQMPNLSEKAPAMLLMPFLEETLTNKFIAMQTERSAYSKSDFSYNS